MLKLTPKGRNGSGNEAGTKEVARFARVRLKSDFQLCLSQRSISKRPGFFPYIRIPVLKILAAAHVTTSTATTKSRIEATISTNLTSAPADKRSIITIGVMGGMNEKTLAIVPLGLCISIGHAIIGIIKINMTGIIKL